MSVRISVESSRNCLDEQGSRCPIEECRSSHVDVEAEPGSTVECSKEHFTCHECHAQWSVNLFAAQITAITVEGTTYYNSLGRNGLVSIETNVFDQIAMAKDPIADVLKDFLRAMRGGSVMGKGEALAKLAHMARVDISSLVDTPREEPQELPSEVT